MRFRRGPGFGRALIASALATGSVLSVSACKSPLDDRSVARPSASDQRSPNLAEPAAPLPPEMSDTSVPLTTKPAPRGSGSAAPTTSRDSGSGGEGSVPPAAAAASTTPTTAPFHSLTADLDPRGDAGIEAPTYADHQRLVVETNGDRVRLTIEANGPIPTPVATDEVLAFGVDVFRAATKESQYQLYAEGGSAGWFAHLQTPAGWVRYPGTFALGGAKLVFDVPWTAVGGAPPARASAFVDWSRKRLALNASAEDAIPDQGQLQVPAG
jgi:hypothetical protein